MEKDELLTNGVALIVLSDEYKIKDGPTYSEENEYEMVIVATLALSLQPRQGVVILWAKRKTPESHHMLPRVPKSVRE
jgi:hypothetical protein